MERHMHVEYDTEADALYVRFNDWRGPTRTRPLPDGRRFLHYDGAGDLVAVEFIEVMASGLDLEGLEEGPEIAEALRPLRVA